jgi:hypothetical protein
MLVASGQGLIEVRIPNQKAMHKAIINGVISVFL